MQKKWIRAFSFILICTLFLAFAMTIFGQSYRLVRRRLAVSGENILETKRAPVWVIDPGHGGEDGGASDKSGSLLEKDLNLAVAGKFAAIARLFGHDVRLTREDDRLLYDIYNDLTEYTGKKKTYDLRNRLRMSEELGATVFIGIHMNKFPKEQYKGLQVYYSPNDPLSADYAAFVQSYVKTVLQPDNTRAIKKATSSIFILHRIHCPAVLVECGFLSNAEDCVSLAAPDYQTALAATLFTAIAECEATGG